MNKKTGFILSSVCLALSAYGGGKDFASGEPGSEPFLDPIYEVEKTPNIVYGTGWVNPSDPTERDLLLDLFRPTGEGVPSLSPACLVMSGESFSIRTDNEGGYDFDNDGTIDQNTIDEYAFELSRRGYICIRVRYRRLEEIPIVADAANTAFISAAGYEDVGKAFDWLTSNSLTLGVDTSRIAIGGHGSGGELAMISAYINPDSASYSNDGPLPVGAVFSLSGSKLTRHPGWIDQGDPPMFLLQGLWDGTVPKSVGRIINERAVEVGLDIEYWARDVVHHYYLMDLDIEGTTLLDRLVGFLYDRLDLSNLPVSEPQPENLNSVFPAGSPPEKPVDARSEFELPAPQLSAGGSTLFRLPRFEVVEVPDIVFGMGAVASNEEGERELKLDLYMPGGEDAPAIRPANIGIFGGGFISGWRQRRGIDWNGDGIIDHNSMADYAVELARRGYVSVVIDYRLLGEDPVVTEGNAAFLAASGFEDAQMAFEWLVDNAATYGVDPNRIAIGGYSAGGDIAMGAAYIDADDLSFINGGPIIPVAAVWTLSAPMFTVYLPWIDAGDPPLFHIHGIPDTFVPIFMPDMVELRAQQVGLDVEYWRHDDITHFYLMDIDLAGKTLLDRLVDFLYVKLDLLQIDLSSASHWGSYP